LIRIAGIVEAAARRGVPLIILDVDASDAAALYAHKLVLVRPDQHVAWRGGEDPAAPIDLIDLVRGAHDMTVRNAA
jgi:aromatic ring hydroxylase-like protein